MNARDKYPAGKKFRVVAEGAHLTGWKPSGPYSFTGARRVLHVGDIVETSGFGRGFGSDPGFGVHFKDAEIGKTEFWPSQGGVFSYEPADGFLEPADQPAQIKEQA